MVGKRNLALERFVRELQGAIDVVADLSDRYNEGNWLIDNYNYRALAQGFLLDTQVRGKVKVVRSRNGTDATIRGSSADIELKSVAVKNRPSLKNLKANFDPRYSFNTGDRNSKAFQVDILVISAFYNEEVIPQATIIVLDGGMPYLHDLLEDRMSKSKDRSNPMASISADEIIAIVPSKHLVCLVGEEKVQTIKFKEQLKNLPMPIRRRV